MANVLIKPDAAVARAKMRRIYAKAEQDIITEITRKRALEYVDYAEVASLERVQAILTDMQEQAGEYIPQYIEKIFYSETEKDASGYKNARALTSTQTNIEQQLVNNLMGSLMEASAMAFETAKRELTIGRLVEGEIREAQLTSVLNQKAAGLSWRSASKNMKIDLQQKGITSFVDKAGREWSLTDYCDMCSRTTARQAEVAAALTADDWDLWQISSIGSTCKLCATYEGRVYSKSGLNPDYPPLSAAFGKIDVSGGNDLANTYLNIHPNCLHSLMKYTTMGKTEEQIQRDKDFSSFEKRPETADYRSKKQRDAYRQKEANRAKLLSDRNQWRRYQTALGKDIPGFEAFRKNKINNTPRYQEWEEKYRTFRQNEPSFLKELQKGDIISIDQILVERSPIISEFTTSGQIAEHFENIKIDKSFESLDFTTQKEIAHGWNYVKQMIGEEYLPKTVRLAKLGENTDALVTPLTRRLLLNDKLTETKGLLTAVHESVHIADVKNGDIAESILKEAFKNLGVRKKSEMQNLLADTMGLQTFFKYRKNYSEQLAWCFERSLRTDKTPLSAEVQKIFLRRLGK